jgi:hypothetical protein
MALADQSAGLLFKALLRWLVIKLMAHPPASKCRVTRGTKTSALSVPLIGNISGFQHHIDAFWQYLDHTKYIMTLDSRKVILNSGESLENENPNKKLVQE